MKRFPPAIRSFNLHFDTKSELSEYEQLIGFAQTNAPFTWNSTTFSGEYMVVVPDFSYSTYGGFEVIQNLRIHAPNSAQKYPEKGVLCGSRNRNLPKCKLDM
jgi:hypothetical protein